METKMKQWTISADRLDRISPDMDLRKRRANSTTAGIVQRAQWLENDDRELVLAMFRDGQSANAIAHRLGRCPRQVRRQIKQLVNRLSDPRVAYVVAHLEKWTKTRRAIARSLFIRGRSMRETTDELGISFYSVRKHRQAIEGMCQGAISASNQSSISISRAWR